jgi:hypothetical protein
LFGVRFTPTANAAAKALSPDQRRAILRIIAHAQIDPTPDNLTKFTLYQLGAMYTIHRDHQGHWVVYHVVGNEIRVVAVGAGGPYVPSQGS